MKKMFRMHYDGTIKIDWTAPFEFDGDDEFAEYSDITKNKLDAIKKDLESIIVEALGCEFEPGVASISVKKKKLTAEWRDMEEV